MSLSFSAVGPVLVTGAAGFIGGHTVRYLRESCGATVIATTRDGRDGTRKLDVLDEAALPDAVRGATAIVHCAVGGQAVTVAGTRNLLLAAAGAGVRRFVHLSSMSVYGDASGRVAENTPTVSPQGDGYAAWKSAAEQACLAQASVEVVRLRPTIVYGPGGSYWLDQTARRVASGNWATFGEAGSGDCNLVHVSDVAGAIAAALTAPDAAGRAFNVNGPETTSWNGFFEAVATAMNRPKLPARSPAVLRAHMAAALPLKALDRIKPGIAHSWLLGVPGRSEIGLFGLKATYPTDLARAELGWSPAMPIATGLVASLGR